MVMMMMPVMTPIVRGTRRRIVVMTRFAVPHLRQFTTVMLDFRLLPLHLLFGGGLLNFLVLQRVAY